MIATGVIFEAKFPSWHIFIAGMSQGPPPSSLALLLGLKLADFGVVVLADAPLSLLAVWCSFFFLLLCWLQGDPSLRFPVAPDVAELICREKSLAVLPIEGIPAHHVVCELGEDSSPLRVPTQVLQHVARVDHEPHNGTNAPIPR